MSVQRRHVTPAELTDGVLAGAQVFTLFMTTDTDVLGVSDVVLNGFNLYQHPSGVDNEPPSPASVTALPSLGVDSWITMPGPTTVLNGGFANSNGFWGDLSNYGAQNNFPFASFTHNTNIPGYVSIALSINTVSLDGQSFDTFRYAPFGSYYINGLPTEIPEPSSVTISGSGALVASMVFRRRRRA